MESPKEHIAQFFAYEHLPPHLQAVSKPFADLAEKILELPRNPERTVALRKLLEAKDAAVRARLAKDDQPHKEPPPVDLSQRDVVGAAVAPGVPDTADRGDGQQKGYTVLADEERARGFVRPVRASYRHVGPPSDPAKGCGAVTTMGTKLAETYAREPRFYDGTFCATCKTHLPVGEHGEFVWEGTAERVGT